MEIKRKPCKRRRQAEDKLARVGNGKVLSRVDPLATAFHEAAHCVFQEAFGIDVLWATCMPHNSDSIGYCLGFVLTNADQVMLPGILHVTETLAGDISEHLLITGREFQIKEAGMSTTDSDKLLRDFAALGVNDGETAYKAYVGLATQTHKLILAANHWIKTLAVELYIHKTLQGDQIRKVLKDLDFYTPDNPLIPFAVSAFLQGMMIQPAQVVHAERFAKTIQGKAGPGVWQAWQTKQAAAQATAQAA